MTPSLLNVSPAFLLEMLNGGALTPETLWLVLLGIYLSKEARRRGLHTLDWFSLPPSMNLILAIFISDAGVQLKSLTVWIWRRFEGAGQFGAVQELLLVIGSALIVAGFLCKIRALTRPDHGNWPWLAACGLTIAATIALLLTR